MITYDEVQSFLSMNELEFRPGQNLICFPKIQRIHKRLQKGRVFSPIEVVDDVILDGHHRYICLCLLGLEVKTKKGGRNQSFNTDYTWSDIGIDLDDHDSAAERQRFADRYD
jgi:hypothetical protein